MGGTGVTIGLGIALVSALGTNLSALFKARGAAEKHEKAVQFFKRQ